MSKNNIQYFRHAHLHESKKDQIKVQLKTIKDKNGFVRVDPRFLTNI